MSRVLTADPVGSAAEWDALVSSLPFMSALQGWGWGEAKRLTGWTPHRLAISKGGVLIAAAQVLRRDLAPGVSTLLCPRGPALRSLGDLPYAGQAVRRWARASDVALKVEPPVPLVEDAPIPGRLFDDFEWSSPVQPEHTVLLDLSRTEPEMLKAMHPMARRNTKTALKLGVTAGEEEDFDAFWGLFEETNRRAKLLSRTRAYYEAVYREGRAYGGRAAIVTARLDGVPLATGMVLGLGKELNYLYGGSTRVSHEDARDPKASNAFYWGMMRWGRENGFTRLDLFGIPRKLEATKHSFGVYQFKERLGGEKVHYPAYELSLNAFSPFVNAALRARMLWLNYRTRGTVQDVL
ncbi:MAG TPA: peptidoglycan bridge formation glycyltransferase FemA/FemB family protein [Deinococcales bacterium]|nr:peptidoglycan bridge formation glycyltransferase FemA/FemB family protein [Deinococcales bacterium]